MRSMDAAAASPGANARDAGSEPRHLCQAALLVALLVVVTGARLILAAVVWAGEKEKPRVIARRGGW